MTIFQIKVKEDKGTLSKASKLPSVKIANSQTLNARLPWLGAEHQKNMRLVDEIDGSRDGKLSLDKVNIQRVKDLSSKFDSVILGKRKIISSDIPLVQATLHILGCDPGKIDGIAASQKQLRRLQQFHKKNAGLNSEQKAARLEQFFKKGLGSNTQRALFNFQKKHNIAATGFLDRLTLRTMQNAIQNTQNTVGQKVKKIAPSPAKQSAKQLLTVQDAKAVVQTPNVPPKLKNTPVQQQTPSMTLSAEELAKQALIEPLPMYVAQRVQKVVKGHNPKTLKKKMKNGELFFTDPNHGEIFVWKSFRRGGIAPIMYWRDVQTYYKGDHKTAIKAMEQYTLDCFAAQEKKEKESD